MQVKVRVTAIDASTGVWLSTPGQEAKRQPHAAGAGYRQTTTYQEIEHMDGIVTLQGDDPAAPIYWVAEFSYGGNPPTTVRSPGAPISAGSSDGNLMIFSALDDALVDDDTDGAKRAPFFNKPLVTTRNYAGFEEEGAQIGTPAGYLFSVAAAEAVDLSQKPTIILYYDAEAVREGQKLVICRYDYGKTNSWLPLPTYLPQGSYYAATPINSTTAPSLGDTDTLDGRVEYYRLFSISG
jgi:hypothetical protein